MVWYKEAGGQLMDIVFFLDQRLFAKQCENGSNQLFIAWVANVCSLSDPNWLGVCIPL